MDKAKLKAQVERAGGTYLDLGAGIVEMTTEGWTDTQIRGKSIKDLDLMISQHQKVLKTMQDNLRAQQGRIDSLQLIRNRKLVVGGA